MIFYLYSNIIIGKILFKNEIYYLKGSIKAFLWFINTLKSFIYWEMLYRF